MTDPVPWLRKLAAQGGKGAVNNIDARSLGRIADLIEQLRSDKTDLLATLQGTIGILEYGVGTRGWNIEADRIAAKVRAAIAKATGTDEA